MKLMQPFKILFLGFVLVFSYSLEAQSATKSGVSPEVEAQILQLQQQLNDLEKKVDESAKKPEAEATEKKPTSGYDGGIFVQSEDGNYKLMFNGSFATRFLAGIGQNRKDVSSVTISPRLSLSGNIFNPKLGYAFSIPLVKGGIDSAEVTYTFNDRFVLGGGFNFLSFDVGMMNAGGPQVVPSLAGSRFGTDSVGVGLMGEIVPKLSYGIGLQNSLAGKATPNANNKYTYFTKLSWDPLGPYGVGAGSDMAHSKKPLYTVFVGGDIGREEASPQSRIIQASAGTGLKFRGFNVFTQGFMMLVDQDDFTKQRLDYSLHAQVGYVLIKNKLDTMFRYSVLIDDVNNTGNTYNLETGSNLLASPGDHNGDANDEYAYSFGLGYNILSSKLRAIVEYTYWYDGKVGQDTVGHLMAFALNAKF